MSIPNKTIGNIKKEGLNVYGYNLSFSPPVGITKYTLCVIFVFWRNRNFSIKKEIQIVELLYQIYSIVLEVIQ